MDWTTSPRQGRRPHGFAGDASAAPAPAVRPAGGRLVSPGSTRIFAPVAPRPVFMVSVAGQLNY